jgi:glycine cleavage system regulatory protein
MIYCIVSATGQDRPGFVHAITQAIKAAGGNIEQQRSARVADEYAVMILFTTADAASAETAIAALQQLADEKLSVRVRCSEGQLNSMPDAVAIAEIAASGADQPGILDALTSLLLRHGINIDTMDFDTESAPMTGEALFRMDARVSIPGTADLPELRRQLRALEDEYNFDILFRCPAGA